MKRARSRVSLAALGAAALLAARADAHEVGLSRGEYVVAGATVRAQVTFARRELIALVAGLDADHDGALTPAELAAARGSIEGALVGRIVVKGDGAACPGTIERAELVEGDGVLVSAVYHCAAPPRQIGVALGFLEDLPYGHRHLARASAGAGAASINRVLSQRDPALSLDVPAGATPPAAPPARSTPLRSGALHVLAPPAAPAFLLALLATCTGRSTRGAASSPLRAVLAAAGAFAAAAAVGVVLGARGLFLPGPRVLGAAVALSLVYVGLEALLSSEASPAGQRRWRVAVPFGVVHGLASVAAFQRAGAPGELGVFVAGAALALGVVTAALVAAAAGARRWPAFQTRGVAALGAVVAAGGAIGLFVGGT